MSGYREYRHKHIAIRKLIPSMSVWLSLRVPHPHGTPLMRPGNLPISSSLPSPPNSSVGQVHLEFLNTMLTKGCSISDTPTAIRKVKPKGSLKSPLLLAWKTRWNYINLSSKWIDVDGTGSFCNSTTWLVESIWCWTTTSCRRDQRSW